MMKNILGREIPEIKFGRQLKPFKGAFGTEPTGRHHSPKYGKMVSRFDHKVFDSLEQSLEGYPLRDGMTIGFHHCLRNGDYVVNMVIETLARMGLKNLTLAPTALFPVHAPLLKFIEEGVIGRIEGSLNGPLGNAVSKGEVHIPTVLRSHGGRTRAVQSGDLRLDISFIAAAGADIFGNLNGLVGLSSFGAMGYPMDTDAIYADHVIAVTDSLQDGLLNPVSIPGHRVNSVVVVDRIGNPDGIHTGSLGRKLKPTQVIIAETVTEIIKNSGWFKHGMSYQAGSGSVSLAVTGYMEKAMTDAGIRGSFIFGGITNAAVKLVERGLFEQIYDAQTFELGAIESLAHNAYHSEVSIDYAYNPWARGGCLVNRMDFSILGAMEVDVDFNVNVNTFSNGLLNAGIGGHQDSAISKITIITVPVARKVPVIIDRVTTVSTPGECIDIVCTDQGVAVNPRRPKLKERLINAGLIVKEITELRDLASSQAEKMPLNQTDDICTLVEYRDGTIIDTIKRIEI
ncbi:MAG: citrate lyase subunit alpha [Candidatus Hodarchaeales archaeon]|jgi:citrate lyase subunit alpha/citrate CoA-transferase